MRMERSSPRAGPAVRGRILNALQELHAQAGVARAVHRIPGLDKPGKVAEFCSARSEQIWQDLGPQGDSAAFLLGWLKGLGKR